MTITEMKVSAKTEHTISIRSSRFILGQEFDGGNIRTAINGRIIFRDTFAGLFGDFLVCVVSDINGIPCKGSDNVDFENCFHFRKWREPARVEEPKPLSRRVHIPRTSKH